MQRALLFPAPQHYSKPELTAFKGAEEVILETKDGIKLLSWYQAAPKGGKTLIYFHGNADTLLGNALLYQRFAEAGFGVLALIYRGYAGNDGQPSEEGLTLDAHAAMDFLMQKQSISGDAIILVGFSLGTGLALKMASAYEVDSVFLMGAYDSIETVAARHLWYAPVGLLMHDRFDSLASIQNVREPLYFFHGLQDSVIPISHAQRLYNASIASQKHFITLENSGHNDVDLTLLIKALSERLPQS